MFKENVDVETRLRHEFEQGTFEELHRCDLIAVYSPTGMTRFAVCFGLVVGWGFNFTNCDEEKRAWDSTTIM